MALLYRDLDPFDDDAGCDLADCCLDCPFERCLQEEPRGAKRYLLVQRDNRISARFREGRGTYQIARELGVSRRTVQRALKRSRDRDVERQRRKTAPLTPSGGPEQSASPAGAGPDSIADMGE